MIALVPLVTSSMASAAEYSTGLRKPTFLPHAWLSRATSAAMRGATALVPPDGPTWPSTRVKYLGRAHGDIGNAPTGFAGHERDRAGLLSLVVGDREDLADSPAGGPATAAGCRGVERGLVVPDDVFAAGDLGAAAAEDERIAGGVVDVDLAVPVGRVQVGGAVVARGDAYRDPERCGGGEHVVEGVDGLLLDRVFGATPADRDHAGSRSLSCTAALSTSRKPCPWLGPKYTTSFAAGTTAPATSMSSMTSPSSESGVVGWLRA